MARRLQTIIFAVLVLGALALAAPGAEAAVRDTDLLLADLPTPESLRAADRGLPIEDLRLLTEYHPETDRWTERNNRIRIEPYLGGWFLSGELDVQTAEVLGLTIGWEVPGFLAIRWDSAIAPLATLEVKIPRGADVETRWCSGIIHSHFLSIGIFNPELSNTDLAFWAGFGGGLFFFDFHENDVTTVNNQSIDADAQEYALAGHIFLELDYKITEIFHVGLGARLFFLNADFTDDGRWYDLNGVEQAGPGGRNDGMMDDVATVTEFTINFSLVL